MTTPLLLLRNIQFLNDLGLDIITEPALLGVLKGEDIGLWGPKMEEHNQN